MPNAELVENLSSSRTKAAFERVLTVQRRELLSDAVRSDLIWQQNERERASGLAPAENTHLNRKEQRHLIRTITRLDEARISDDQQQIQLIEGELGGIKTEMADRVIDKVEPPLKRLKAEMMSGTIRSREASEALTTTTKELLSLKNINNRQYFRKIVDHFELAGYNSNEAKELAHKAFWSAVGTPLAWFGASGMSVAGAVFFNHLSSEILAQYFPTVAVPAAFSVHAVAIWLSTRVSKSNIRLLNRTGYSLELNTLITHTIGKQIVDSSNKSLQENMNHAAYWFFSPRIYEELAFASVNIVNPPAAVAAHLAAAAFFGIRIAAQEIASAIVTKRKKQSEALDDTDLINEG